MSSLLSVQNLHASAGEKKILQGVDLTIGPGEVHLLMGPNGSGKSTLAQILLGDPKASVSSGKIFWEGEEITSLPTEERAKRGMYLGFQYPVEIPGLPMDTFLRSALVCTGRELAEKKEWQKEVARAASALNMPDTILNRNLNEGFSGGEKKRSELLQLQILRPKLAIIDEFDSGLDIDGLHAALEVLRSFRSPRRSLLLISHYGKIVEKLRPDFVHIMSEGKIALSGGAELVNAIEELGFANFFKQKTNES